MKKRMLAALFLAVILLAAASGGCAKNEGPGDPAPSGQEQGDDPAKDVGDEEQGPEAPDAQGTGEEEPPAQPPEPFASTEASDVFALTKAEILARYGEPDARKDLDYYGGEGNGEQLRFGANLFEFEYMSDPEGQLTLAVVTDEKIAPPRGFRIGDTLEELLEKLPDEGGTAREDGGEGLTYRRIYGEVIHNATYGAVDYAGEDPVAVRLADEGVLVTLELSDGKLARVRYMLALT